MVFHFFPQYLNSGAGGIGGLFVHEKFLKNPIKHLHGWFSNKGETLFDMREKVDLAVGADSFRISNPPPWLACLNLTSLKVFKFRLTLDTINNYNNDNYKLLNRKFYTHLHGKPCVIICSLYFQIFQEAGIDKIVDKQFLLTGYLEYLLLNYFGIKSGNSITLQILTPSHPKDRGAQLSLSFSANPKEIFEKIKLKGVVVSLF